MKVLFCQSPQNNQSFIKIYAYSHKTIQFFKNLLTYKLKNSKIEKNGYLSALVP